jgi:AraC-like DNA-binding protein
MGAFRSWSFGERLSQVGAYFRAAPERAFVPAAASGLTYRVVALQDLWGSAPASELEVKLAPLTRDLERINCLEAMLAARIAAQPPAPPRAALNLAGLASAVIAHRGNIIVESLANAAGVPRQHLARQFGEAIGVGPKLYCRLVRFRSALAQASRHRHLDWAQAALALGYTDQSHLIREFREFSGTTPTQFAPPRTFHPFAESALG